MSDILHALLIEDCEDDATLIIRTLQRGGFTIESERVETRSAMSEALARRRWDVVIADYHLPEFSGLEALEVLQASGHDTPFLLVSGAIGEETAVEAMRAGARDYIMKHRLARLVPAVRRELAEAETRRQRQALAAALAQEQNRFRALVEQSSEAILIVDSEGRVSYESPPAERVFGYAARERIGRSAFEFVHPDDAPTMLADFSRLSETPGAMQTREFRYRHKSGEWRWLEGTATNLLHDPDVRGFVANIRDITSRKLAEQALAESKQRLQAVLDHSPALIYMKDLEGRYILTNRLFDQKFARVGESLLGKTVFEIFPPDVAEQRHAHDLAAVAAGQPITREETSDEPDGRHIYLASKFPLLDGAGKVYGVGGIGTDITERKSLEAQFLHAQKMEAFGQLAGGIAHDFNNILTAILIQLDMLVMLSEPPPEIAAGINEAVTAARRAAALTRQLLLFSRRQVTLKKNLDLNDLLTRLVGMLRPLLGERVELRLQTGSRPALVHADAGMIEQIVMNLCVNARDAMPRGGRLVLAVTPVAAPDAQVCLAVTDTGTGMDAATQKRIFEPFFTTKEVGKGTGLGLATVYGIVKQHGGSIEVQSKVGAGTTFRVFLPALATEGAEAESEAGQVRGGTETILLVEDEPTVRGPTAAALRRFGYRVLEAGDAPDALHHWQQIDGAVDLLFTDFVMPGGLTGLELADTILRSERKPRVIITTGHGDEAERLANAITEGITFLPKPFTIATMLHTVRRVLDVR